MPTAINYSSDIAIAISYSTGNAITIANCNSLAIDKTKKTPINSAFFFKKQRKHKKTRDFQDNLCDNDNTCTH